MTSGITTALEHSAQKLDKTLVDDAGKAVSGLYGKTHENLAKTVKNHAENEAKHEAALQAIQGSAKTREELRDSLGKTPVYRIKDDGTVEKLTKKGPQKLDEADRKRLEGKLKLDSADKVEPAKPKPGHTKPYPTPASTDGHALPRVNSQQVDFGHDELARATQLARHENKNYGGYRPNKATGKQEFQVNNYAALRHGEEGDPDGFILVGRSSRMGRHSEPTIGIPLLEGNAAKGITALYTEREPCSLSGTNCGVWMHHYLPGHVKFTHSVEYGDTLESRAAGNRLMEHYMNALRVPWPFKKYQP